MHNINLFVEDITHEDFLTAVVNRFANRYNIEVNIKPSSVRGGHGKVITELEQYLRDLQRYTEDLPDLVIVGTDSNCKGLSERKEEIDRITSNLSFPLIHMIPNPHIERWFLLDSEAFKTVFGRGCPIPDQKCERGRYKDSWLTAIHEATKQPPLDGNERIEDLVNAMNIERLKQNDPSIKRFLDPLERQFRTWKQEEN